MAAAPHSFEIVNPGAAAAVPVAQAPPRRMSRRPSMRDASIAAQSHLKKHKVKHGIGCGVIITVAVVLGVVLGAVAAVVVYNKNQKQATEQQKADGAKAASAAVNLGEISVLPPKKEGDDAASRRLFGDVHAAIVKTLTSTLSDPGVGRALRGLESSGQPINTASFDALSDYNTTTTATSVDDGMSNTLVTPNMIICMLSQTKAEKFFNKGPYIANVDESKCHPQGNSQDAGPRITPWHIVATGPADTASSGLYEVAAWLELPQGGGNTMTLEFKVEVDKSQIEFFDDAEDKSPEVKAFQIQFRPPEDHLQLLKGFIRTRKTGPIRTMQYAMSQTFNNQTLTEGVSVSYDENADTGWAKQTRLLYNGPGDVVLEQNLGWNSQYFKQSESLCLDREKFVAVGQEYKLFDNTGTIVDVESQIDVKKTIEAADSATLAAEGKVIAAGTTFEGGLSPWGFYVYPEWINGEQEDYSNDELEKVKARYFGAGEKVRERTWNSAEKGVEYTISKIDGLMSVEKQLNLPVSNFEGAELIVWTYEQCPANSTAGVDYGSSGSSKVTVKNGKFMRIAQRSDSFADCDCPMSVCHSGASAHGGDYTPTTWVPVTEAELSTDEGISFYSSGLGSGYVSPSSPDTVRVSNHGDLRPNKDGSKSKQLICFRDCIDGAKLATASNEYEARFDNVWPSTRASAHMYTFDEQTGILTDSSGTTIMKEEGTSRFYMTLLEDTTATFTELGCADSDTTECSDPQVASTIYRWQTGSQWSSVTFLTDEAGTVRAPMRQIELKIVIPKSYDPRTLSGSSYAGKTILVDYQNGWISGLPIVCQDEQTMTYREADYETYNGKMYGRCNYNANEREVSDFLLPRGVIAVSENIFAGTKTEYVLKPTWVRQKLKNTSPGDCSGIAGPPTGTPLPSMDLFGTMRMPPRPTTAEVKVESGTIMVTA